MDRWILDLIPRLAQTLATRSDLVSQELGKELGVLQVAVGWGSWWVGQLVIGKVGKLRGWSRVIFLVIKKAICYYLEQFMRVILRLLLW